MIKLVKASKDAIKYACMTFHYAKRVPVNPFAFAVFNDDVFCGVVAYSYGANNNLAKCYNLPQGAVIELVRMALNGKHGCTSKVLSLSLKLIKKACPLVKLVVSYADEAQGHKGTIYQATNWYFVGDSMAESAIDPQTGKICHTRSLHAKYGSIKGFTRVKDAPKHKYLYPLHADLITLCKAQSKPYPKLMRTSYNSSTGDAQSPSGVQVHPSAPLVEVENGSS